MMTLVIFVHVIVCILICLVVLMQSGRGGGLTEAFASAESVFGAGTNTILVRATTILGAIFLVTCLTLAYVSSKKEKSLMSTIEEEKKTTTDVNSLFPPDAPTATTPSPETNIQPNNKENNAVKEEPKAADDANQTEENIPQAETTNSSTSQ